jgi:hypothetical protein
LRISVFFSWYEFRLLAKTGSALTIARELNVAGKATKLAPTRPVGEAVEEGRDLRGARLHAILAQNRRRASQTRAATPALLKGLIFGPDGKAMAPTHTRRRGRLYRFYRTATSLKLCHGECPIRAVPAGEVEAAVIKQVRVLLRAPEVVVRTWRAAWLEDEEIDEREVLESLQRLRPRGISCSESSRHEPSRSSSSGVEVRGPTRTLVKALARAGGARSCSKPACTPRSARSTTWRKLTRSYIGRVPPFARKVHSEHQRCGSC